MDNIKLPAAIKKTFLKKSSLLADINIGIRNIGVQENNIQKAKKEIAELSNILNSELTTFFIETKYLSQFDVSMNFLGWPILVDPSEELILCMNCIKTFWLGNNLEMKIQGNDIYIQCSCGYRDTIIDVKYLREAFGLDMETFINEKIQAIEKECGHWIDERIV